MSPCDRSFCTDSPEAMDAVEAANSEIDREADRHVDADQGGGPAEELSFAALTWLAELQGELLSQGMGISGADLDLRLCLVLNWTLRKLLEERRRGEGLMAGLGRAMDQCDEAWRRYYQLRLAQEEAARREASAPTTRVPAGVRRRPPH